MQNVGHAIETGVFTRVDTYVNILAKRKHFEKCLAESNCSCWVEYLLKWISNITKNDEYIESYEVFQDVGRLQMQTN